MAKKKKSITKKDAEKQAEADIASQTQEELPQPDPLPNYDSKFNPIHEHIQRTDVKREWPEIRTWLATIPNDTQTSLELLGEQPDMSMRAKRLALLAKREYVRFELDWKDKTAILRDIAREYWETKKKSGMRKQITNDMIDDWIIEHYGETWKEMYLRLCDMKNTAALIEQMSNQVDDRAADLRRFVEKHSQHKPKPTWLKGQKRIVRGRKQ